MIYPVDSVIHPLNNWGLVHSTLSSLADHTQATPAGTFSCHRPRCRICDFTERTATVSNADGDVRLKGRFDSTAAGVVYVITCQRCCKLYIGETGRGLANRFGEHLRSVEVFKQNPRRVKREHFVKKKLSSYSNSKCYAA